MAVRFLEYRRALFVDDGFSLEALIRDAWRALPTTSERVILKPDDSSVMGLDGRDFARNGFAIHCGRYIEQQGVGVVDMTSSAGSTLKHRSPGNAENFLNSDFFALCLGNNLITLNAGKNAAGVRSYLHHLFVAAGLPDGAGMFTLLRIPNADSVARIDSIGVASIRLDLGIEEATALAIADNGGRQSGIFSKMTSPFVEMLRAIAYDDGEAAGIERSNKGTMRLELNVPKGDLNAAKVGLDAIATEIVQDEEASDYVIMLRSGEPIRPGQIAVKKQISLERFANTFDVTEVWAEMTTFMAELRAEHQLEV